MDPAKQLTITFPRSILYASDGSFNGVVGGGDVTILLDGKADDPSLAIFKDCLQGMVDSYSTLVKAAHKHHGEVLSYLGDKLAELEGKDQPDPPDDNTDGLKMLQSQILARLEAQYGNHQKYSVYSHVEERLNDFFHEFNYDMGEAHQYWKTTKEAEVQLGELATATACLVATLACTPLAVAYFGTDAVATGAVLNATADALEDIADQKIEQAVNGGDGIVWSRVFDKSAEGLVGAFVGGKLGEALGGKLATKLAPQFEIDTALVDEWNKALVDDGYKAVPMQKVLEWKDPLKAYLEVNLPTKVAQWVATSTAKPIVGGAVQAAAGALGDNPKPGDEYVDAVADKIKENLTLKDFLKDQGKDFFKEWATEAIKDLEKE